MKEQENISKCIELNKHAFNDVHVNDDGFGNIKLRGFHINNGLLYEKVDCINVIGLTNSILTDCYFDSNLTLKIQESIILKSSLWIRTDYFYLEKSQIYNSTIQTIKLKEPQFTTDCIYILDI